VMQWWQNIMPLQGAPSLDDLKLDRRVTMAPGGPDPAREDRVMLMRNRVSRIYYQKHFFDYPISLKWQTLRTMGFITTLKVGFSYLKTVFVHMPETSLENFYINSFGKKLYSMFFEGYTEKLWGRHPREIAADWGAQRTKGLSIRGIVKDMLFKAFMSKEKRAHKVQTSLIEEFRYPKYGPGHLWETVALDIEKMGGKVLLNREVAELEVEGQRVMAARAIGEGQEEIFYGDVFISSMPLKDLVAGLGGAPEKVREVAQGLPYRDFVTVGLLVNKLNIANQTRWKTLGNIIPDCWIYVQDSGIKLGRIQVFNNWSPYMVQDPEHTVWLGLEYFCAEGDDFWNMAEEDCVRFAVEELVAMGILSSREQVLDSRRERVQKAYPAYFGTYHEIGLVTDCLNGFANLYCVGRNGQHRYNNMDHSMATAFEAIRNISNDTPSKDNVWNVNTEQVYHEKRG